MRLCDAVAAVSATVNKDGDVNDPKTGYSPFPGNVNQLVRNALTHAPT